MTVTGTTSPEVLETAPALTVAEVRFIFPCPLCAAASGIECEHELLRMRVAVRVAAKANR